MKMKKYLSLFLSCTMCFSALLASGCNPAKPEGPAQVVEKLELEDTNLFLTLGDRVQLPVSYNKIDGQTLSWSSSSPSVVSVDANGVVEGMKVGSATITVRYGTKKATCRVEVALSGNVPVLTFGEDVNEEIALMKGTSFDLGARILFNGKTYEDGAVEYYVDDENIGCVEDGCFVAKTTEGSTLVSVFATWRGQVVQKETIKVSVVGQTTVLLNGGKLNAVKLYTVDTHEGVEYATSQTISSVYVAEDGEEITDYTLSVKDEEVVTLQAGTDEWLIEANGMGTTTLVVSYAEKEFTFDVSVLRPVHDLAKTVDYSNSDGMFWNTGAQQLQPLTTLTSGLSAITSYQYAGTEEQPGGEMELSIGEGKDLILYNGDVGYSLKVNAYTTVIDQLEDFKEIYAGEEGRVIEGSFILAKDIIQPETVLEMPAGKSPNDFGGIFDGRGHVLSFTLNHGTHKFGLFGQFLEGAIIKNVAFNNVTKTATAGGNPAGLICYEGKRNISSAESLLENVFVNVKFVNAGANKTYMGLMHNVSWSTMLKNVIIYIPEVPVGATYGAFARGACSAVNNSYVISAAPRFKDSATSDVTIKNWLQPTSYADYSQMKAAKNNYASFSSEYWDTLTYGVPVWKTLVADFTM